MIRLEAISKSFGEVTALAPLDLEIPQGDWLGIFGRNGSGKTSLLRILVGLSRPSEGRLLIEGRVPTGRDWLDFHARLGFMPERLSFHEALTGEKTLRYYARLRGVGRAEVGRVIERVGLEKAARRRVAGYSKGMLQRLNLAQALLGDPEILVLDEPIEGLDPHGVREFFELIGSGEGRTVILSSHQLPRIAGTMSRVCILTAGRLAALGTEAELMGSLDLPLRITIHPSATSNGHLESDLRKMGATSVTHSRRGVEVEVPQELKIAFLSQLQSIGDDIDDLRVEEPSLEEVFLETN